MAEKIEVPKGKRVYFLSDAHLGSGDDSAERERELCRLIDEMGDDCGVLILLGDMFDFWFTYRHVVPKGHVRFLGRLAELADRGVEIHYYIGNHDMWLFDYLEHECHAVMHDEPTVVEIGGRRLLIGHGDGLGHQDRAFDVMKSIFRNRMNQRMFSTLPPALTMPIARRWSDNNKEKHARQDVQRYLGDEREGIVIYCKERLERERFDYCVFGHRHVPIVRVIGDGCVYVNTGDWLTHRTYAVYDPATGEVELRDARLTFRAATLVDVEQIMQLVQRRIDWMNAKGLHQWNETDYFGRYPRNYWEERISRFVVAERDGEVVAAIALYNEDVRWTRDGKLRDTYTGNMNERAYYLHHLVTDPDAKGIGWQLMQYVEDYARRQGVEVLRLDSAVGNSVLERYYTAMGYVACGECRDRLYSGVLREKRLL